MSLRGSTEGNAALSLDSLRVVGGGGGDGMMGDEDGRMRNGRADECISTVNRIKTSKCG